MVQNWQQSFNGTFFIVCLLHFEQCASHSGVQLKQVAYAGPGRHKGIFYYKIVYVIIDGIPKFRPKFMGHFFFQSTFVFSKKKRMML